MQRQRCKVNLIILERVECVQSKSVGEGVISTPLIFTTLFCDRITFKSQTANVQVPFGGAHVENTGQGQRGDIIFGKLYPKVGQNYKNI